MKKTELLASPEGLQIAESYIRNGSSTDLAAKELNLSPAVVSEYLAKREVKNYIDTIYFESGFRNRDRIAAAMDAVISHKLEEMDETGLGSNKDIADLLKMQHDMRIKELELEAKIKNPAKPTVEITNNTQVNYQDLVSRIIQEGR